MKTSERMSNNLPELPVKLFELGAKLGFSDTAPVIVNRPDTVTLDRPQIATPSLNRSSHEVRKWFGWALYPKVVCYPLPDPVVLSAMKLDVRQTAPSAGKVDLIAAASERRYYKLTGFKGIANAFCEVRYGPWFALVTEVESCDDELPNLWTLKVHDPAIALQWQGTWEDRPTVPHLTVIVDFNTVQVSTDCCPGYTYCPTSQNCLRDTIKCPDAHPA